MEKVAVLGGGGTGCTVAADMALKGMNVALYEDERYGENLRDIREKGGVIMYGQAANGFAKIGVVTNNLKEAVEGAVHDRRSIRVGRYRRSRLVPHQIRLVPRHQRQLRAFIKEVEGGTVQRRTSYTLAEYCDRYLEMRRADPSVDDDRHDENSLFGRGESADTDDVKE